MGLEEAIYRNIDACKEIAKTTRSAYGPHGMSFFSFIHILATQFLFFCFYITFKLYKKPLFHLMVQKYLCSLLLMNCPEMYFIVSILY